MENEEFEGSVWEPAAGNGWMGEVIKEYGHDVGMTDLYDRGNSQVTFPLDFLSSDTDMGFDNIITNPPYNLAEDFIHKALKNCRHKVAMLLRLAFLEGVKRQNTLFKIVPPARVHVFSERITFYPDGVQTAGSGTTAYGWFVWDKTEPHQGTELLWLPTGYKSKE